MAFRDETEALRQRVGMLEGELETERERLAEARSSVEEAERLRGRVQELEAELAKHAPPPPPPPPITPARPQSTAERQKKKNIQGAIVGIIVLVVIAAVIVAVNDDLFGPDEDAAPTSGMVVLADHPSPPPLSAHVRGTVSAGSFHDNCRGYVPDAPLLVLRAAETTTVRLLATSSEDTVLVLRTADGTVHCDDDTGGNRNPLVTASVGPGDHRVWVGTYADDGQADVVFAMTSGDVAAVTTPTVDLSRAPAIATISGSTETPLEGSVQGIVAANTVSAACPGFLPVAPHAVLRLEEPRQVRITTHTTSGTDLVMLVRTPEGTIYCDDDRGGSYMPLVEASLPAGDHRVWIGTYRAEGPVPFTLSVETAAPGEAFAPREVERTMPPMVGRWSLDQDQTLEVASSATGIVPTEPLGAGCNGFAPVVPHFVFTLAAPRHVTIEASGAPDLELMIGGPDGSLACSSAIDATWPVGEHLVWIGAREARSVDFRVNVRSTAN